MQAADSQLHLDHFGPDARGAEQAFRHFELLTRSPGLHLHDQHEAERLQRLDPLFHHFVRQAEQHGAQR
ncbi:MAG: hypothetical protein JSS47_04085, partial [Proteobacteria bacterium]|nr:hypothetical protein [Pseudomonadota bacterium]